MDIIQAIILAVVQGFTEFLPISSSGHLVVLPWIFNWEDPGLTFDVALHFGTLIAILIYFWNDIVNIFRSAFKKEKNSDTERRYSKKFLWILVVATIPGALAGFFFEDFAETIFRSPLLVAGTLITLGLFLYLVDRYCQKNKKIGEISWKEGLFIGFAQALAIIPGVSRSGSTITMGLFLGLNRVSAARFSFLLSAPIIFGASLLKAKEFFSGAIGVIEIIGIIVAAVSGYLAIAGLIKFVESASYKIFFWYRLGLGILLILFWILKQA